MSLNLIKLCVGAESVEDLEEWIGERLAEARARGLPAEQFHTTRMMPTRGVELVDGGSLYWVIKGNVQCRQRLTEIRPFTDNDGIARCRLVLDPEVVRTAWQPPYWDPRDDPEADRADAIRLRDALAHLHVYRWGHDGTRHPLVEGADRWPAILRDAAGAPTLARHAPRAALLEFVADDDPAALLRDAATLRGWLAADT